MMDNRRDEMIKRKIQESFKRIPLEFRQDQTEYEKIDNAHYHYTMKINVLGERVATVILQDPKEHSLMPASFKCRLTRATLRKKIEELNEKIKQLTEGSGNENDVAYSMTWFTIRNIPIQFILYEGVKILDESVVERLIPMEDEAILAALNTYYLEHRYEYATIPETHQVKRTVRRMKGLLESKGYSLKVSDVFYIDGAE